MFILKHPDAQCLLADARLAGEQVRPCAEHLSAFIQRYLPCFQRAEQRGHAVTVLRGKLTDLERKTTEPIARQAGQKRRPLQLFIGAGGWDGTAVVAELQRHVAAEIGHGDGVYLLDSSGFPKKGEASCGVARQWCGRLGKVDNCQVGVFLAYTAPRGSAVLDARLYLPQDWAGDPVRRLRTHVPAAVAFQEKWRIGLDLLDGARQRVRGRWVVGDDEFGRCAELRGQLRLRRLRYLLDVPSNTLVREPTERRPPTRLGGRPRRASFERVDRWLARQPAGRWRMVRVRDGERGPMEVGVLLATVQTKDEDGRTGGSERLVVFRSREPTPRTWYALSNAREARRPELTRVHGSRHRIEELFEAGNGEVGLDHYEVRSWPGWNHHMALSLVALWFLQLERLRLGGKNTGHHRSPSARHLQRPSARTRPERGADRGAGQPSPPTQRRSPHLSLVPRHRHLPAAAATPRAAPTARAPNLTGNIAQ